MKQNKVEAPADPFEASTWLWVLTIAPFQPFEDENLCDKFNGGYSIETQNNGHWFFYMFNRNRFQDNFICIILFLHFSKIDYEN